MNMEDEMEWNSSMINDGIIVGTMDYMYKKGCTLQEANYVLFDDTDDSYAPILKAMSNVNQTHPDILLKEMILKNPAAAMVQQQLAQQQPAEQQQPAQQQQPAEQQQPAQQQQPTQNLAATHGATSFGGAMPRGAIMDNSQNFRATSKRDLIREHKANKTGQRIAEGKPVTAGEYAGAGAKATGRGLAAAGRGIAAGAGAVRDKGKAALRGAKDFVSGKMGRDADGQAKPGMMGRMSSALANLGRGIKNTPQALAENRAAKRGRISNEGALGDKTEAIRQHKNQMLSGGSAEQQQQLAALEAEQGDIQGKLNQGDANLSFRQRVKQIGQRGAEEPPAAEEPPQGNIPLPGAEDDTETPPLEDDTETGPETGMTDEQAQHSMNTQMQALTDTQHRAGPETGMPTDEQAVAGGKPLASPAAAVQAGAEKPAVAAAQEDKAPEETDYSDYGDFAGQKSKVGRTKGRIDAQRSLNFDPKDTETWGDTPAEQRKRMREKIKGIAGGRTMGHHDKRMEEHMGRRGWSADGSEEQFTDLMDDTKQAGGGEADTPAAPLEDDTETPPLVDDTKAKQKEESLLQLSNDDPMVAAWNQLMILKHR